MSDDGTALLLFYDQAPDSTSMPWNEFLLDGQQGDTSTICPKVEPNATIGTA